MLNDLNQAGWETAEMFVFVLPTVRAEGRAYCYPATESWEPAVSTRQRGGSDYASSLSSQDVPFWIISIYCQLEDRLTAIRIKTTAFVGTDASRDLIVQNGDRNAYDG